MPQNRRHLIRRVSQALDGAMAVVGNALASRPFTTTANRIKHAQQRVARGWDDTATWSLDTHLARTLGSQLIHLADTSHGYPGTGQYTDAETWVADLKKHGEALERYAADLYEYRADIDHQQLLDDAQAALHWVADNFPSLWD